MIAVLGAAGIVGRNVVQFLEEWRAPVARRDARLEGNEHVDASQVEQVAAALEGSTVCLNCVDYRLNLAVMEGALRAGAHYVDLGGLFHMTRRQLELGERFRGAGLTAILGLGSAPGKTNLLARAAVERLNGEPRSLEIWAATRDPTATDHPFPAPYSVRTLVDELRMSPVVLHDGALKEVPPMSGSAERAFPEPVGRAAGIYTLHSELATLPAAFPSLREASFRLCLHPGLIEKLLALEEGVAPEPYVQTADSVAVHLVEVRSESASVAGMTITHGGSARSTAEPAARAASELHDGGLAAPGVNPPEVAIADPERFLAVLDTEVRWKA